MLVGLFEEMRIAVRLRNNDPAERGLRYYRGRRYAHGQYTKLLKLGYRISDRQ